MKSYQHLSHDSLPIFINHNSELLILGSFPSVKSREIGFYYGHKQNRFFLVLSRIFLEDEPISVENRKEFLSRHKIALYDVIYSCSIVGSSDSSIKDVVPIDIEKILKEYPNIKVIGVNGGKAKSLFDKYLLEKVNVNVIYLPSTSPANAKCSLEMLRDKYQQLFK